MPSGAGGGLAGGSFVASGNIIPSRFVKLDTSATGKVLQAGTGESPVGVSQQGVRNPSYPGLDDGFAAIAGENVRVYMEPEECMLEVDNAYNPGTLMKPGAAGIGTQATADADIYGAIVLDASSGNTALTKVRVTGARYRTQ